MDNSKVVLGAIAILALSVLFSFDVAGVFQRVSPGEISGEGAGLEFIPFDGVVGPESLAFDADGGGPYTGVSDGRILKWDAERRVWVEFSASASNQSEKCQGSGVLMEHVCGRPLGLAFSKNTGNLYIADAYLGLLRVVGGEKSATPILTEAQGQPFNFANSLDIDPNTETIYFTDSSMRFQRRQFMSAVIAGDSTGRVMKYNPNSKEVEVLLNGLSFPNGVALSEDGSSLVIAETITCRILKYRLRPPEAGSLEVLLDLPGFPDNIKRSPRGGFWVALHSPRTKFTQRALSIPWVREMLLKVPSDLIRRLPELVNRRRGGGSMAMRIGEDGEVLEVMDFGGKKVGFISEVEERNGSLWIGSVVMPFVGVYKL